MEGFHHAILGGAYRPADHIPVSALLGLSADSAAAKRGVVCNRDPNVLYKVRSANPVIHVF